LPHPQQDQLLQAQAPLVTLQVQALLVTLQVQLARQLAIYSNVQLPQHKAVVHQHQLLKVLLLLLDQLINQQQPNSY
jgi:hypothetical protein